MLRQKPNFLQIGVGIALLGVIVKVAITLSSLLNPIANLAILVGVVLAIIGLVVPGRR